jgi:hypothetical protein
MFHEDEKKPYRPLMSLRQRHELKIGHRGRLLRMGETFRTRNFGRYYSRRQVDQWLDVEVVGRLPLVETWSAFHNGPFTASQATKRTPSK